MISITDLYKSLFGRRGIADGNVIDLSEHGRTGGVSTGQPFKFVSSVSEQLKVDPVDASTTYLGKASFGQATSAASWQIKKVSTSGVVITIQAANGSLNYDQAWDARASLSYS